MTDRDTVVRLHCFQEKQDKAIAILQEWANKQGHERCHWHPEVLQELADVFGIKPTVEPKLPPRAEFEIGCKQYQDEQYGEKGS